MTERELQYGEAIAAVVPYHCLMSPTVELPALFDAFTRTPAKAFLEIGTFQGATAAAFALVFPEAKVTTIDLPDPSGTEWNPQVATKTGLALRVLGLGRVEQVQMSSENLGVWAKAGRRFDMVFVDGDHTPESVVRDVSFALDLLNPGGSVVAHDYTDSSDEHRPPWTIGVHGAVETVMRTRAGISRRRLAGWLVELRKRA